MNKKLAMVLVSGAFALGVNCSEEIRSMRSFLNEKVSDNSYERPYSLKVISVRSNDGIETYLYDPISKKSKRVLHGMELERKYSITDIALDVYALFD